MRISTLDDFCFFSAFSPRVDTTATTENGGVATFAGKGRVIETFFTFGSPTGSATFSFQGQVAPDNSNYINVPGLVVAFSPVAFGNYGARVAVDHFPENPSNVSGQNSQRFRWVLTRTGAGFSVPWAAFMFVGELYGARPELLGSVDAFQPGGGRKVLDSLALKTF